MKTINKNIPNMLSTLRICLTPVVIALFLIENPICKIISFVVYAFASCTDFIDGYLARKYNLVSDIGKLLDASADKCLQSSALILVLMNQYNVISLWASVVLALIFILRDCWISTVRQLCASKNVIIAADIWGKIKSILMDVSLGILFLFSSLCALLKNGADTKLFADLTLKYVGCFGIVLLTIAAVFCILSAFNYTKNAWGDIVGSKDNSKAQTEEKE